MNKNKLMKMPNLVHHNVHRYIKERGANLNKNECNTIYEICVSHLQLEMEKHAEEIKLLDEYIKLLEKEVSRVGGLSIAKPYLKTNSETVAKGQELRDKILAIRNDK